MSSLSEALRSLEQRVARLTGDAWSPQARQAAAEARRRKAGSGIAEKGEHAAATRKAVYLGNHEGKKRIRPVTYAKPIGEGPIRRGREESHAERVTRLGSVAANMPDSKDAWSPQARQAAAEARRRKSSAKPQELPYKKQVHRKLAEHEGQQYHTWAAKEMGRVKKLKPEQQKAWAQKQLKETNEALTRLHKSVKTVEPKHKENIEMRIKEETKLREVAHGILGTSDSKQHTLDSLERRVTLLDFQRRLQRVQDARDFLPINDAGTSEGARKAAQTRKAHGGNENFRKSIEARKAKSPVERIRRERQAWEREAYNR